MPIHVSTAVIDANGQEIKQHGSPEFPCACYSAADGLHSPWHWHDEFECSVIHQGCAYYNTPGGHFLLHTGDGIFINSGTLHSTEPAAGNPCQKNNIVFHGRLVYGSTDSIFYKKYIRAFLAPDAPHFLILRKSVSWQAEVLERIKKAARLCQNGPEGYEFTVRSLLAEALFDIYCYNSVPIRESSSGNRLENERVKQMILYLQENFSRPVTLAELAARMNVCERECLRCFKKMLRLSPIQYLIRYRISRACTMLKETDISVLEVGSRCGFESPSYFTKTFRELVGCTPTGYRKREK